MDDYLSMTEQELLAERERIAALVQEVTMAAQFADTPLGKLVVKRMSGDLDAIRRKYFSIRGDDAQELAMSLVKLQGREQGLIELVELFAGGRKAIELLNEKMERISAVLAGHKLNHLPGRK